MSHELGLGMCFRWQRACLACGRPWVWCHTPHKLEVAWHPPAIPERSEVQGHLQLQREFKASLDYLRSYLQTEWMRSMRGREGGKEREPDSAGDIEERQPVCVRSLSLFVTPILTCPCLTTIFSLSAGISYSKQGQGRRHCSVRQPRVTQWHLALFIHRLPGHFLETPYREVLLNSRSLQSTAAGDAPRCALQGSRCCWPSSCPTSQVRARFNPVCPSVDVFQQCVVS